MFALQQMELDHFLLLLVLKWKVNVDIRHWNIKLYEKKLIVTWSKIAQHSAKCVIKWKSSSFFIFSKTNLKNPKPDFCLKTIRDVRVCSILIYVCLCKCAWKFHPCSALFFASSDYPGRSHYVYSPYMECTRNSRPMCFSLKQCYL